MRKKNTTEISDFFVKLSKGEFPCPSIWCQNTVGSTQLQKQQGQEGNDASFSLSRSVNSVTVRITSTLFVNVCLVPGTTGV